VEANGELSNLELDDYSAETNADRAHLQPDEVCRHSVPKLMGNDGNREKKARERERRETQLG
jgi:hypothetical protein